MPTPTEIAATLDPIIGTIQHEIEGLRAVIAHPDAADAAKRESQAALEERTSLLARVQAAQRVLAGARSAPDSKERHPTVWWQVARAALGLGLGFFGALGLARLAAVPTTDPLLTDLDRQVNLLAFVVALAAYLQVVASALKTRLADAKGADEQRYWDSLWRVLVAEQMLVGIAILISARMVLTPGVQSAGWLQWWPLAHTDHGLVGSLVAAILYLARLHSRHWRDPRKSK